MRYVSLRGLLGVVVGLGLVLAACSSPKSTETNVPDHVTVGSGDLQTDIDLGRLDLKPLSFWNPPSVTCPDGSQKRYATIIAWVHDRGDPWYHWYPDIFWIPYHWQSQDPLVLYAHGYIAPGDPGFLTQLLKADASGTPTAELQARDALLCEDHAVAASSYSKKGWAEAEGFYDTQRLSAIFRYIMRVDRHQKLETYIFGASMGGLITVHLAEAYPDTYAGAMPLCGPIGGSLLELNYIGNVRLLYDHFLYQSADPPTSYLGDTLLDPQDPPLTDAELLTRLQASLAAAPSDNIARLLGTWIDIASIGTDDLHVTYDPARPLPAVQLPSSYGLDATIGGTPEMESALAHALPLYALFRALRYDVRGALDIRAVGGGWPMDTSDTVYQLLGQPFWMGWPYFGKVDPFYPGADITPALEPVRTFMEAYQPSGDTSVPLLTLHTRVDPDVPLLHELVYADLASEHPDTDLRSYVAPGVMPADLGDMMGSAAPQEQLVSFGHCNFQGSDLMLAFKALEMRARAGISGAWPDLPAWSSDFTPLHDFASTLAPALQP